MFVLCIYKYMYAYVCIWLYVYVCMYTWVYVCICLYMSVCTLIHHFSLNAMHVVFYCCPLFLYLFEHVYLA